MTSIRLPRADGTSRSHTLRPPRAWSLPPAGAHFNRIAYAAAHVVADPLSSADPWLQSAIDWDSTLAYRSYLWSLGLGVAEAMDTAQRGMGLDWSASLELIDRALELAHATPGARIACGAGASPQSLIVDRLDPCDRRCLGGPRAARAGSPSPPEPPSQLRLSATQLVSEPGDLRLELRAARLCPGDGNHMTPIRAHVCHGCAPFGVPDHAITAIPLFGSLSQSK